MTRSKSYIATPPGFTIKEQLKDRGMSQKEFASRMAMSEKHISNLINGAVQLTHEVANRLEMVLGVPAKFWNNLETIYREKLVKIESENSMEADVEFAKKLPYKKMADNGWVPKTNRVGEKVVELRKFFETVELELLFKHDLIPKIACRRQAVTEKADYALIVWAQKAKLEARQIDVSPINLEHLTNLLPEIRKMTLMVPEEFAPKLVKVLADCGVALVFLPHIENSFLNGATFFDKKKVVLGLTVRGRDADKFWFSLFHEIGHILLGHLSQTGTSEKDEFESDEFAKEQLIPAQQLEAFTAGRSTFSQSDIIGFARQIEIDPGIVVGRLQKEGFIKFNWHNELKTKYEISA
ncbi:MAG: helix-turn-helix domain-containing protein [Clostridiales bacterium]|nr:helix-turn-helix domain-containing protein [Clostridiales bacterium]